MKEKSSSSLYTIEAQFHSGKRGESSRLQPFIHQTHNVIEFLSRIRTNNKLKRRINKFQISRNSQKKGEAESVNECVRCMIFTQQCAWNVSIELPKKEKNSWSGMMNDENISQMPYNLMKTFCGSQMADWQKTHLHLIVVHSQQLSLQCVGHIDIDDKKRWNNT